jgi:hypothetical protein
MNSPLVNREVRLRGLSCRESISVHRIDHPAGGAEAAATKAESPANCAGLTFSNFAPVHSRGARQELSAQADIALS